jgi:hypothetical protein
MAILHVGAERYRMTFWPHGVFCDGRMVLAHLDREKMTLDVDARCGGEKLAQVVATLFGEAARRGLHRLGRKYIERVPVALVPIRGTVIAGPDLYWDGAEPSSAHAES